MGFLFTSESVSEGHPDKVADQISDALLDEFLRWDPNSKVACETMVTTGLVVCGGEVKTKGWVDIEAIARKTIRGIGYTKSEYKFDSESCGVITTIHEQSPDIHQGVVKQNEEELGAGDQGMMFGYASAEMDNLMPIPIELSHRFLQELAAIRKENREMTYLRPDSKSQVTLEYDSRGKAKKITTILISTQHDEFDTQENMLEKIRKDIESILIPRVRKNLPANVSGLFNNGYQLIVNPSGKFVIGGPHGDTGLTGRKIIVDTYGGTCAHGGGAFSGKDASKVDRSGAYAARHIAKNIVGAGIADEVQVQVAYAIGMTDPLGILVDTMGSVKIKDKDGNPVADEMIAEKVSEIFDLRPYAIIRRFGLKDPVFLPTASYGHFGRDPYVDEVEVYYEDENTHDRKIDGVPRHFKPVEFFAWEKLDYVEKLKEAFGVK